MSTLIRASNRAVFLLLFLSHLPLLHATRIWVVDQKNTKASDGGPGTDSQPFKTINRAAQLAKAGDTVEVHAGVYRERVAPKNGGVEGALITYEAAPGETVYVRGSDVLKGPFVPVPNKSATYSVALDPALFAGENPYATQARGLAGKMMLGQIFLDGHPLNELDNAGDLDRLAGSWMAEDGGKQLVIHMPTQAGSPPGHLLEYSVRDRVFAPVTRGLGYIVVRGFIFEHCANQGLNSFWGDTGHQAGMVSTRSGNHWTIENNVIRFAKSLGIDFANEGGGDKQPNPVPQEAVGWHLLRNNIISDNGETGMTGLGSHHVRIEGNTFERNNALGWTAVEEAALKTHFLFDAVIEGNIFRDNHCPAIWIDNTHHNVRVSRNVITGSVEHGIFIELGFGPDLIDNNIVAYTRSGDGIYAHDASGITVAHNLLLGNSGWGVLMRVVTDRPAYYTSPEEVTKRLKVVETSDERIVNNLFVDNYHGAIALPPHWERSRNVVSDYNVFVTGSQWNWIGVTEPWFAFDDCEHRITPEQISAAVFGQGDALAPDKLPLRSYWKNFQYLTFEQWQKLSGFEQHSMVAEFNKSSTLEFSGPYLKLDVESFPFKLETPSVAGVERDFEGKPMPANHPLAGPFQRIEKGKNSWLIAPLAGVPDVVGDK